MKPFEIIMAILGILGILISIVAVHVKSQVDIARINTSMKFFQKDLDNKEIAICNFEKDNKADHNVILGKIESIIDKINEK